MRYQNVGTCPSESFYFLMETGSKVISLECGEGIGVRNLREEEKV